MAPMPKRGALLSARAKFDDPAVDDTIRELYVAGVSYFDMTYDIIKRHGRQYNYRTLGDRARALGCSPAMRKAFPKSGATGPQWSETALARIRALYVDQGKSAANVALALSGKLDGGRKLTRAAVGCLATRYGWQRPRAARPRGLRRKYDPWVDELIREQYIEGTPWPDLLKMLADRGVHLNQPTLKTRANSLGLRERDRKVKVKPLPPARLVPSVLADMPLLPYRWTAEMDAALREYAAVRCTIVVMTRLLGAEFDRPVEQSHISDRLRALGVRLRDNEVGNIGAREAAGYAIGGRRFWSQDGITREQALRQLKVNGFYYRLNASDRNTNPAWGFLADNRASLERTIIEARAHFGVTDALPTIGAANGPPSPLRRAGEDRLVAA